MVTWDQEEDMALTTQFGASERVIRPAAVVPERAAREMMRWLEQHDVTRGGCWLHDTSSVQRFDQPFNGPSGMRGSAVMLGSIHITWDRWDATIYRANVTEAGAALGMTVDSLCDEVLRPVGLTLASCPRAHLVDAPVPDPFRRIPRPSPSTG
jgi:hypothetical protein